MLNRLSLCMLVVLCVTALPGLAYRLELKDNAGAKRAYRIDFTVTGVVDTPQQSNGAFSLKGGMKVTEKVLSSRSADATILMEVKDLTISGVAGGKKIDPPPFKGLRCTYDRTPSGQMYNFVLEETGQQKNLYSRTAKNGRQNQAKSSQPNMLQTIFPASDLFVGDGWGVKYKFELAPGMPISIACNNTLAGTRVVNGKTYVLIDGNSQMTMPFQMLRMFGQQNVPDFNAGMLFTGKSSTLFNAAAGALFRTTFSGKMTFSAAQKNAAGKNEKMRAQVNINLTMKAL